MEDHYADPLPEAAAYGFQRALQIAPAAVTTAQVLLQMKTQRLREQTERQRQAAETLHAQERAEHHAARLQWLPANNPAWLRSADLLQVSRAWGAAMPYAAHDPGAERARLKCEERLRQLHPYGMNRYDRLRADGLNPADAMRQAAPFFAREPHPRTGHSAPTRKELPAAVKLAQQGFPHSINDTVRANRSGTTTATAVRASTQGQRPAPNRKQ
ncbi:hypothetical protein [Sphaerimonospora thailandensis]|uniref:Uncharacterized protein n=1 Tax=Sphaerimonospora thailandensis TaxID=795644 RepID=A0A8J3VXX6_9ACTN|nr:hypothetical protein [Sphaerimonospora thailandensis]GIH68375.1 hypothetical protein Mth01_06280 [Sphaerimonospora thailandensis]